MLISYAKYLGDALLAAVFLIFGFAGAFGFVAARVDRRKAAEILIRTRSLVYIAVALSVVALALLAISFLSDDFSTDVVARYSSINLPLSYKFSAVWAGSDGSLLLWAVGLFILFALWLKRFGLINAEISTSVNDLTYKSYAFSVGSIICLGFSALLLFIARPFAASSITLDNGSGLNPQLLNFWMVIHPPLLFVGYSALLIPFVCVLASAFAGNRADRVVLRQLQWWMLFGIFFLSLGIATGSIWSYVELGWGGYWAWDPVENASLLPWLLGVAALHCLVAMRFSDKFEFWAVALAPVPFILCLFATFITRSGVLQSVHAYGQSIMSTALLAFIVVCLVLWGIALIRLGGKTEIVAPQLGAPFMRVIGLLSWANLLFVLLAVVIAMATFWPLLRRLFTGSSSGAMVTRGFYDNVVAGASAIMVFLLGLSKMASLKRKAGYKPCALVSTVIALIVYGLSHKFIGASAIKSLAYSICAFSFIALLLKRVIYERTIRRFGATVAHLGLMLLVVTAGLSANETELQTPLVKSEKARLGQYEFAYESFKHEDEQGITKVGPLITARKGAWHAEMWPHNAIHAASQQGDEPLTTSEVAVHSGLTEDLYISFDGVTEDNKPVVTLKIIPFMLWLWMAFVMISVGFALALVQIKGRQKPGTNSYDS